MRARLAHSLLILAGLAACLWALTWAASPDVSCRGVSMRPGDVCANADGTQLQTYEQRAATALAARPVVGIGGLLVAGFGGVLFVADARRRPASGQASRLIGP